MSDPRLSAIGQQLGGAPDHLVERSAAARADASGVEVEEVLAAWSGGEALAAAPPSSPAQEAAPVSPAEPAAAPPAPAAPSAPAPEVPLAATAVLEEEEEPEEAVEPAPWRSRVRLGARAGAALGLFMGLASLAAASPLVLGRLTEVTEAGSAAVEVTWTFTVAIAALWAVIGSAAAVAARGAGRFLSPAYDTDGSPLGSVVIGGLTGLVIGFARGGAWYALAETSLSGTKLLSISPWSVLVILAADAACGAAVGAVTQFFSQPRGLRGAQAEDAQAIRRRLSDSLSIPLTAVVVILIFVVALGTLLVRFPSFAPWVAILVSLGILTFAGMMASRPNLRVTRNEVLVAAAGVGVVLLMITLIAAAITGDDPAHHGPAEDTHAIEQIQ